jgi:ribonuclease-3
MQLQYEFSDAALLQIALTHRSADGANNERLEYLGDALLGFVVAEYLFRRFPAADEGQLTRARASLVNKSRLAEVARTLDFADRIRLGEGELRSGGWRRDSILANTLEALIGAIYLDAGFERCREVVLAWFGSALAAVEPAQAPKDPKTELQEYLQARRLPLPEYATVEISGDAHQQDFLVSCRVAAFDTPILARGASRRRAEQQAAAAVLARLRAEGATP